MQVHIAKLAQLSERLLALYGGQRRFRIEAGTVRLAGSLRRPHFWPAETSPSFGTKSTDPGVGVLPAASDKAPELSCADRDWLHAGARAQPAHLAQQRLGAVAVLHIGRIHDHG
jgi:hypothetical protein